MGRYCTIISNVTIIEYSKIGHADFDPHSLQIFCLPLFIIYEISCFNLGCIRRESPTKNNNENIEIKSYAQTVNYIYKHGSPI